jgi:maleylpyruvate isomerase
MKITLHSYWRSSASHRVRIGLGLKELAYDYVAVNILEGAQGSDAYRAKNPMAQVPTLEITDDRGETIRLTQSVAILEYLDERWPEHPLLPRDAYLRAKTRALVEIVNAGVQPLHNLAVLRKIKKLGADEVGWARGFVAAGLAAFAQVSDAIAGTFSVGDAPTIADIYLLPQLLAARRFQVELDSTFDRLLAIEARCLALPAFANAVPERQPDANV